MSIGNCPRCGGQNDDENEICIYCQLSEISLSIDDVIYPDIPLEPDFYECAMCGMEIISFELVRGRKYCHSCAAIELHG